MKKQNRNRHHRFGYKNIPKNKSAGRYSLVWSKKIRAINLLGGHCKKCNTDNVFVLEFHHLNPGKKDDEINQLLRHQVSWRFLKDEVKKCILLCRNCHSETHYSGNNKIKTKLLEIKGQNVCSRCGFVPKTYASLDFHHRDVRQKDFRMSSNCALEKQLLELDKCDVLCKNCHMMEHININRFNKLKKIIYEKVENHREYGIEPVLDGVENMYCNQGLSCKEIARKLNYSSSLIEDFVRDNGLKRSCVFEYLSQKEKDMLDLREGGMSLSKIARAVGFSKYKVLYNLRRLKNKIGERYTINIHMFQRKYKRY